MGNPVAIMLSGGQTHDSRVAIPLLETISIQGSRVLADRAYGSKTIRDYIRNNGAEYVIPAKQNSRNPWEIDWHVYKERHLVECFFNKIKQFRRVATRYDKLAASFITFVYISSITVLLK